MKIAVLGSGAMGGLYSSYLSRHNEVTVIDVNAALVEKVNAEVWKSRNRTAPPTSSIPTRFFLPRAWSLLT